MAIGMGLTLPPVIIIGDRRLAGFNPAKIDEALAKAQG